MTTPVYPVALVVSEQRCLVVGGGALALEKIEGLLRAGAVVSVVSPVVTHEIGMLAEAGEIEWVRRQFRAADLDGIFLAYGADDDRALNAAVALAAREAGVLVNAVDDIPNCDFFAMSIVRRGDLQVAISTSGQSPAFARRLREILDERLPEDLGDLLDVLAEVRRRLRARGIVPAYERWKAAITADVLDRLDRGDRTGARERIIAGLVSETGFEADTIGSRTDKPLLREVV